jgi:xylulokinase
VGKCLRDLTLKLREISYQPAAVAATGQMNGPVLLDRYTNPVRNVPLWCDTLCAPQCRKIYSKIPENLLLNLTGHSAVTGYTAPKLLWLSEHEPESLEAASYLIFPKDYITKLLTGVIVTDYSDASNSLLLDIHQGTWSKDIVHALNLEKLNFPELANGTDIIGYVSKKGSTWSGLPEKIPVAAGLGDSISATIGAGIHDSSVLQIVIGTAGNVNCVLKELAIDHQGRVHTGLHADRNHWICSGVLQASGASLQWWSEITEKDLNELIGKVKLDTPSKVVFGPYLAGERSPHLDPFVRGAFLSLDGKTTQEDMTRAVLEGVAFSFRDVIEIFYGMGIRPHGFSITGGGGNSDMLCHILSNVVNRPLERITADTTARGVAVLAAYVAGIFSKWQDAARIWQLRGDKFSPERTDFYQQAYENFRALYPHLSSYTKLTTKR